MDLVKWKKNLMLLCAVFLILMLAIILLRRVTIHGLVGKWHMHNLFTKLVLIDMPTFQTKGETRRQELVDIDWANLYPFPKGEVQPQVSWFTHFSQKLEKSENKHDEAAYFSRYIPFYHQIVEFGRFYEDVIGWKVVNPAMNVTQFADGYFTFDYPRTDMTERISSTKKLADFCQEQGVSFLFVQAPTKTNKYGDKMVEGILDFANTDGDELLIGLANEKVDTLDLREKIQENFTSIPYHQLFYRTDHHWKPQTGLWAAGYIANVLERRYGLIIDTSRFSPNDYFSEVYPDDFLGSQGKKVTLARTSMENFELIYPKFPVQLHVVIPAMKIDKTGDFSLLYDKIYVGRKDPYNGEPYSTFCYGDQALMRIENLDPRLVKGAKVIALTDSFGDTMVPFLSLGVHEVIKVDARHFTGSIQTLIRQEKPDIVLVMYTPWYKGKINWQSHKDEFDFR